MAESKDSLKAYKQLIDAGKRGDVKKVHEYVLSDKIFVNHDGWNEESSENSQQSSSYHHGYTPLMEIVASPYVDLLTQESCDQIINLFIEAGLDLATHANKGILSIAALNFSGNKPSTQYYTLALIKAGIRLDSVVMSSNPPVEKTHTPLDLVCIAGLTNAVKSLIKYKVNVNIHDVNGFTPLRLAYLFGFNDIVDLLINSGAENTITSKDRCEVQKRQVINISASSDKVNIC